MNQSRIDQKKLSRFQQDRLVKQGNDSSPFQNIDNLDGFVPVTRSEAPVVDSHIEANLLVRGDGNGFFSGFLKIPLNDLRNLVSVSFLS